MTEPGSHAFAVLCKLKHAWGSPGETLKCKKRKNNPGGDSLRRLIINYSTLTNTQNTRMK